MAGIGKDGHTMKGWVSEGARRVWNYQRVLWWMFAVNLALAAMSATPVALSLRKASHSVQARSLVEGFDLAVFMEMAGESGVNLWSRTSTSLLMPVLYFFFVVFMTGGTLEAYASERKIDTRRFFASCGAYLWRFVRLLLWLGLALMPVAIAASGLQAWADHVSERSWKAGAGFRVMGGGGVVLLLVLMVVRLWFDMAQVVTVVEEDRSMRRALMRAGRIYRKNFGRLTGMYVGISLLAWVVAGAAFWLWTHIPGPDVRLSLALWEVVLAWWIGTRLWQRASEMTWYQRWAAAQSAVAAWPAPVVDAPAAQVEAGTRIEAEPESSTGGTSFGTSVETSFETAASPEARPSEETKVEDGAGPSHGPGGDES